MIRSLVAAAAIFTAALGLGATVSAAPWYGPRPIVIAYTGPPSIGQYHVQGRVVAFDRYHLGVTVNGRYVRVHLHPGTVINPTGLTLQPGMYVRVNGFWMNNEMFDAGVINLLN